MARATFRATDFGKTLDSAIDMATNFLFVLGLTLHLGRHGGAFILWTGFWAVGIMVAGRDADRLAERAPAAAPLSFDLLKRSGRGPRARSTSSSGWCRRSPAATASPSCSWC